MLDLFPLIFFSHVDSFLLAQKDPIDQVQNYVFQFGQQTLTEIMVRPVETMKMSFPSYAVAVTSTIPER